MTATAAAGGAGLPLRPRPARQHLRRPPAAAPGPRARRAGRAQGAAGPATFTEGSPASDHAALRALAVEVGLRADEVDAVLGLRPVRRRGARRRGPGPGVRHQRRAVLRRRRPLRHLRRPAGRPGPAGARAGLGRALAAHPGRAPATPPAARATAARCSAYVPGTGCGRRARGADSAGAGRVHQPGLGADVSRGWARDVGRGGNGRQPERGAVRTKERAARSPRPSGCGAHARGCPPTALPAPGGSRRPVKRALWRA